MQTSESINDLATALSKAQGEITGALKDSANPFFKSKYADLASCWDACRVPLSKNGLSVVQGMQVSDGSLHLITRLLHNSGQWISSVTPVAPKDDSAQAMGSALTYARRYALTAMVGVAQVDDDGNQASGRPHTMTEVHSPKGDLGKSVPIDTARRVALEMMAIIDKPAVDGDHDEGKKALDALDYHERVLNPDEDLYVAVGDQLTASKRNVWKALVKKARDAQKADEASDPTRRRF